MGDHRGIATDRFAFTDLPDPAEQQPILTGTSVVVARLLGVSVLFVRVAFVLLALASGLGIGLYLLGWFVLVRGHDPVVAVDDGTSPVIDQRRTIGLALIVLAVLLSALQAGWATGALMWPAVIIAVGVMVAWRHVPDFAAARQAEPRDPNLGRAVGVGVGATGSTNDESAAATRRSFRRDLFRQLGGAALVLVGVGTVVFSRFSFATLRDGLIAGLIVTIGIGVIFGPWVLRAARTAMDERRERVRSEERADMAAHLHDSVLQTLTLIQKRSDTGTDQDSREISTLARRQERELRRWLYGRAEPMGAEGRFRSTLDGVVADVEDLHGVGVESVVVGDAPIDPSLESLIGAIREALVNAAKFSGRTDISLFVEVGEMKAEAFVRDRGGGFDVDAIPEDRHGIRDSIQQRMHRIGGRATIRSVVGEGTEVELTLPRRSPPVAASDVPIGDSPGVRPDGAPTATVDGGSDES